MMTVRQQLSSCVTCVATSALTATASSTYTDGHALIRDRLVLNATHPIFTNCLNFHTVQCFILQIDGELISAGLLSYCCYQVFKEEEEAIKVDLHEGCGRTKLFWLMALADSKTMKAMVEFREHTGN